MGLFGFGGKEPTAEELDAIEREGKPDLKNMDLDQVAKEVADEVVLINNDPIAYCKAQELPEGGVKTHGQGIKESDKEIPVGTEKYIPINDFKGI